MGVCVCVVGLFVRKIIVYGDEGGSDAMNYLFVNSNLLTVCVRGRLYEKIMNM